MSADQPRLEVLQAASEQLRTWGNRWYVFGAQAVTVWGRPRLTADIDITAQLAPDDPVGFARSMESAGFDLRVNEVWDFVARTRVLPFLHRSSQTPLDVVLAGPGLEEQFLDRAVPVEMDGLTIPVISPEDLIITKILAGRPKDIDDVRGVVRERRSSLDIDRIESILELLEQALSRSDLLSVFRSLSSAD